MTLARRPTEPRCRPPAAPRAKPASAFLLGTNPGQRGADRHLGADLDQHSLDLPGFEDFDLDRALLRLHHGDDIATLHAIAGLDHPFDKRARLHVGAERGHAEFRHDAIR